jgi:hypothetical protein
VLTPEQQAEREEWMKEFQGEMDMMRRSHRVEFSGSFGSFSMAATGETRNRKVEAFEKVETQAGAFDCYKITYELVVSDANPFVIIHSDGMGVGGFPQQNAPEGIKCIDWLSPEVGLVKREKYNARGKLQEVVQLESYTR